MHNHPLKNNIVHFYNCNVARHDRLSFLIIICQLTQYIFDMPYISLNICFKLCKVSHDWQHSHSLIRFIPNKRKLLHEYYYLREFVCYLFIKVMSVASYGYESNLFCYYFISKTFLRNLHKLLYRVIWSNFYIVRIIKGIY